MRTLAKFHVAAFLMVLVGFCGISPIASANVLTIDEDATLFGNLDQHNTDCNDYGCGPTAAVNSFVSLQNRYPKIYGNSLVAPEDISFLSDEENFYLGEEGVANILAGVGYMNCGCNPGPDEGTDIGDFISGKMKYINEQIPDVTDFLSENFFSANKPPDISFIADELLHDEDVEILMGFYVKDPATGLLVRDGGHYVTLTGLSFSDQNNNGVFDSSDIDSIKPGTLKFIDPDDGLPGSSDIYASVLSLGGKNYDFLFLPDFGMNTVIEAAVSESPKFRKTNPAFEPTSLALFGGGLAFLVRRAGRRRPRPAS